MHSCQGHLVAMNLTGMSRGSYKILPEAVVKTNSNTNCGSNSSSQIYPHKLTNVYAQRYPQGLSFDLCLLLDFNFFIDVPLVSSVHKNQPRTLMQIEDLLFLFVKSSWFQCVDTLTHTQVFTWVKFPLRNMHF